MSTLVDRLRDLFGPKKPDPTPPAPDVAPEPKKPGVIDYVRAWQLLKSIPIQKLGSVIGLSGLVVFFAISGVVAWLAVFARFFLSLSK